MDSHSQSHSKNRSRFQIPPPPLHNNNNVNNDNNKSSSGRFEFGAASKGTLTTDQTTAPTTGTHSFSLYSSSLSTLDATKLTVPSSPVSFDALMFEAMGKNNINNLSSSKVSKMRHARSGKKSSSGRVPAKDLVHNYSFQSVDQRASFDEFLSDRSKSSSDKHTFQNDEDDVFDQFRNLEPFRAKIDGDDGFVSNSRHADDSDMECSLNQGRSVRVETIFLDDSVRGIGAIGSKRCNGRKNVGGDASEIRDIGSCKHKAFVFGTAEVKSSISADNPEEFQSDKVYGEFETLDGDYGSSGRSAFRRRNVASGSLSPMNNRQLPSMYSSSVGGRFDSKASVKERVMRDPSVGQSYSYGSSPGVSLKNINNQAATGEPQGGGGTIRISSPVGSSMFKDSSLQTGESLHSIESLSSNLNHTFQFAVKKGVTEGHNGRRNPEKNNVPSSSIVPMRHQSPRLGGELSENAPVKYDKMIDSEHTSMPRASPFQSGDPNQHNLHQSDIGTNVKEAMSTNENSQSDIDEKTNAEMFYNRESPTGGEHQFRFGNKDGRECSDPARSSKWTSSSFNRQAPVPSSATDWLNHPFEKVRTDNCESGNDNTSAVVGGSTQRRRLTSKPSSGQSFLGSGHAKKSHRTLVEGNAKSRPSIEKFESSPFALRPLVFQTDAIQRYVSSSTGNFFDSNQIVGEEKKMFGACDRCTTAVPESMSGNQSAKSDLPANTMVVKNAALPQACESWRHRGNQAYTDGDFSKAEEYYSRGISCVSPSELSEGSVRSLVLCYGNRAATRIASGRVREALSDCLQALKLDPNFVKARIRAASCYVALGECELALSFFNDCLKCVNELETMDSKLVSEVSEGIRKTQQVDEKTVQAVKLLSTKKSEDVSNSLCLVNDALSVSPHSEKLFGLKAQALLSLCKYEDMIQACEEGLASFNQNHYCDKNGSESQMSTGESYGGQCNCLTKLRLWQMIGKAQFYLGRLDEALTSLLKYEEANTAIVKSSGQRMETVAPLIATIRDLLHHKTAGNEAFQANKFAEAEKHYTAALACNTESRHFTAVCFCNRAAASHAQGHIADAIADCSQAMALDSKYLKAISRRSILHEMIRNYGQATTDLQRLITLQEIEQQNVKGGSLRRMGSLCNSAQDLKDAHERLAKVQEDMKKGIPLDHYLILGVESSSTAVEIKKAYRKAALKHHPDKAAQFLVRSDVGDDELLKECGEDVRRDAEKLFQMIAEAYAILSDPSKRLRYDAEEELRKLRPTMNTSMAEPESQSNTYQFEKSSRQHREGWDAWKDYENHYYHWHSSAEGIRTDNSAHQSPRNTGDGVRWNDHKWNYI